MQQLQRCIPSQLNFSFPNLYTIANYCTYAHHVIYITCRKISCNDSDGRANDKDEASGSSSGAQVDEYSGSSSSSLCATSSPIVTKCLPSHVCGGSASVERGFVTEFTAPDQLSCKPHANDTFRIITEDRGPNIPMNDDCNEAQPYV